MLHAKKEEEKFESSNIMEGMISVSSVISGRESGVNTRKIERVLYDAKKARSKEREIAYLKNRAKVHGFEVEAVDEETINSMTVGNSHGGIVAVCSDRQFFPIVSGDIISDGFYVLLEGIEDPYNFGYALRSIYAAGAEGIILSERNWMSAAGVVARASAGASEQMKIYVGDPTRQIKLFTDAGYVVFASDKTNDSVSVYDADMKTPLLLLVGGERRGLSAPTLALSDKTVCIDYGRRFPAALSAASAASIISFEIFRQNRGKNERGKDK